MIKLQSKLPREVYLACSGGVDSMAILDFLRRNHLVHVLHFDHGTAHGSKARAFLESYCAERDIPITVGSVEEAMPANANKEQWWREHRYAFFDKFYLLPIITCHHLDDCVETWVWSSLNGTGKWIPYRRNQVIRPFRLTRKQDLKQWAELNAVPWIEDISNEDTQYTRNYIRHEMMSHILRVNPGIHKTIAKKVKEDDLPAHLMSATL